MAARIRNNKDNTKKLSDKEDIRNRVSTVSRGKVEKKL